VDRQHPQYRIRTFSLEGNTKLKNYLNAFPLFGVKYLNSLDWFKVLYLFKLGKFDHSLNIENVKKIKLNMNDKRKTFT